MYDSLGIWMPSIEINNSGYLDRVPALLSNISKKEKNDSFWISGNLENLRVSVSEHGISINGSPNKFYHGYNDKRLTRQEMEFSIEKLSDVLRVDARKGNAQSFDVAHNFMVKRPTLDYYPLFGSASYYRRELVQNSLYYKNKQRTIILYDKVKELMKNSIDIPPVWNGRNVLRIEVRFLNRIKSQFNISSLKVKDLYQDEFYIQVLDRWKKEYMKIRRNKVIVPKEDSMTSLEAERYLLSHLIQLHGHNEVDELINDYSFTNTKAAQRFKNKIHSLDDLSKESELTQEIDEKVERVTNYYR